MSTARAFDPRSYWRRTLARIVVLLLIWIIVGPVMGVIYAERLNSVSIGGVPLGFWMAQQGAIYVFVGLIFVNAWLADRMDREYDIYESESGPESAAAR